MPHEKKRVPQTLGPAGATVAAGAGALGLGLAAVALSALGPYRPADNDEPAASQRP
jgi:hypothetical protein